MLQQVAIANQSWLILEKTQGDLDMISEQTGDHH